MRLLFVAARAVLLPFRAFGVLAPVLGREIIPAFAHRAFHDDVFAGHLSSNAEFGMRNAEFQP
jgi:hypothetical protein